MTAGMYREVPNVRRLTTKGPVVVEVYEISHSLFYAGGEFNVKLSLKNDSMEDTFKAVTAKIICDDSYVTVENVSVNYGDMVPGAVVPSNESFNVKIADTCPGDCSVGLLIDIATEGFPFWSDTLTIYIQPNDVFVKETPFVVQNYTLHPNYPNPFNAATTIQYSLAKQGHVQLAIYDLLGRRVRLLSDGIQKAGSNTVTWDGTDQEDRPVPSGVYFCRMETIEGIRMIKVACIR